MDLATALQILSLIPPLQFGTPAAPVVRPEGAGTLLVAGCRPGETVVVLPGPFSAVAGQDGVARIRAAAQAPADPSYLITTPAGQVPINGTLNSGELLSGACPL